MSIKVEGDEVIIRLPIEEWVDLYYNLGTIKGLLDLADRKDKEENRTLFGYRDCIKVVDQCLEILSNKEGQDERKE